MPVWVVFCISLIKLSLRISLNNSSYAACLGAFIQSKWRYVEWGAIVRSVSVSVLAINTIFP